MKILNHVINVTKSKSCKSAIMMSGGGSNAVNILLKENLYKNLNITSIVTDNPNSNAKEIAKKYSKDYIEQDRSLYGSIHRGKYFDELTKLLNNNGINFLIYAGFMKIASKKFTQDLPGINMHPSDLTITSIDGTPKYTGMNALSEMIDDRLGYINSSVHVIDVPVDHGSVIAVSSKLHIDQQTSHNKLHEKLKKECEHILYPEILKLLASGSLKINELPIFK